MVLADFVTGWGHLTCLCSNLMIPKRVRGVKDISFLNESREDRFIPRGLPRKGVAKGDSGIQGSALGYDTCHFSVKSFIFRGEILFLSPYD